jgi:outer membrane protein insertion porin family
LKKQLTIWLYGFACVFCLLLCSCSLTKSLEPGQYLYDGSKIRIKSKPEISHAERKQLTTEMTALLRPKPNTSILGIRYKLLFYNLAGKPTGKGIRYWIKNKLGEPPVLASVTTFSKNREILQNRLENRGYFKDSVIMDTASKNRKMKVTYTAILGFQYKIRKATYPSDSSALSRQIQQVTKKPLLKPGDPYNLDVIKNERSRIDTRLKQRGFYYFNPDYILVTVDSSVGKHEVDMNLLVKRTTPQKAKEVYFINNVTVYAAYDISSDTIAGLAAAKKLDGLTIVDPDKRFRSEIFPRTLVFKPGAIYNRKDHDISLNRLISLGVFKFVKVRFEDVDTPGVNKLDAFYYLTPTEKKSIRFEVSGLTKSNSSNGGELGVTWRNRNIFKGAELLTVNVYGGIERQYLSGSQPVRTNKAGIDVNLYIPKGVWPVKIKTSGAFVPKTRINLGYEYFQRTSQYTLNSFKTSYGYIWKESVEKEHQLNLLSITFVKPTNITPEFQLQLDTNITLARSIERQFIIGPNYNFNINTQLRNNRRPNNFYFNANLDLSGILFGLVTGANLEKGNEKKILNTTFSEYVRTELDFRHYLSFGKTTTLASRITGGIGYSFGNSLTMPFVKEFFAGGANDLRAFRSRSLGPGSFYAGNRDTAFLPDQPGDIKLEMNTEFRFKLVSVFRWAFFADAGNIWTLRTDSSRPGSKISGQFLNQVAVGVGTGLRVDISIIILRLDLGVPVREPYRPAGQQWVFDTKNMVWNFAIGYPF